MPRVLIVTPKTVVPDLSRTILWRRDVERVFASDLDEGLHAIRTTQPQLVVLAGDGHDATVQAVSAIRANADTRRVSLAVVCAEVTFAEEDALRRAGANVVLCGAADPAWDPEIEDLLHVPPRREARVPVRFAVWNHAAGGEATAGASVNLSTRGMLLETDDPVDLGARLDLAFRLPGEGRDLAVLAQVVREEVFEGQPRYGLEFLVLREAAREHIRAFVELSEAH